MFCLAVQAGEAGGRNAMERPLSTEWRGLFFFFPLESLWLATNR